MADDLSGTSKELVPRTAEDLTALDKLPAPLRIKARELSRGLDFRDSTAVLQFGSQAQANLNQAVDPVLKTVATRGTGPAGELLTQLLSNTRELDPSALQRTRGVMSRIPLIGRAFSAVDHFVASFETIGKKIDQIVHQLDGQQQQMRRDIGNLDRLFDENIKFREALLIYIAAGEIKLKQLQQEHVQLVAKAQSTGQTEDAQAASDMQSLITRLERKVHDLKLSALVSLQTGPQIRLVQSADEALAEKIQTSLLTTIPLWKRQMVMAIALHNQQAALKLQREVSDTTNELLTKNAEMLKQGVTGVAQEVERGVVDIETLQKTHQALLETIEDTLRIQEEGRKKRADNEKVIEQLESDLKTALTGAQTQKQITS